MEANSTAATCNGQAALQALVPSKLLYSKKEAAQLLSLSVRSVDNLTVAKELKAVKIGKSVRFHHDELERFAKKQYHVTHAVIN